MIGQVLFNMYKGAAQELVFGVKCEACEEPAQVHMLVTRHDGEMKEAIVCKNHMLDPGPLLDW